MSTSTNGNGTIFYFFVATTSTTDTCTDISICRTTYTIVWSSLVTILACVWTAVHRNVPAPKEASESGFRRIVGGVMEAGKIVVVTVLVPEWVLAWAVRQFLNARKFRKRLEGARKEARRIWEKPQRTTPGQGEGPVTRDPPDTTAHVPSAEADSTGAQPETVQLEGEQWFNLGVNVNTGRMRGKWTARHGFAVIMGGFHFYVAGEPQHPLSAWDVVRLVENGELVLPTDEEIRNWSQSDVLSKALAVVQTLWFVVQAIARRIEGLPITQLEIMTLAYTTITVAMYVAWWDKPQNVGGPVRVAVKQLPRPDLVVEWVWYVRIFYVIAGWHDDLVDLRKERRVPTFYSGSPWDHVTIFRADVIALCAAMVFGAVHCAAWHYAFPSHAEKLIWRVSSLAIVALPAVMLVPVLVLLLWRYEIPYIVDDVMFPVMFCICAPLYIAARLLLLALSFSTLRSLPPDAYRAVQWTLRIPHFA
ncbi:hypothetical protein BV25DRAFT_1918206 [Artomyces pyxidatus]|uniref:Uncharacterized protein n=1 Tax=Artomyces pyxidatus TaxID=48021 RepID=A0ACB8SUH1_9AGAM|nr:hypothetical protein BV25DRAFT_1918206 [Artomyces pyxidatus]